MAAERGGLVAEQLVCSGSGSVLVNESEVLVVCNSGVVVSSSGVLLGSDCSSSSSVLNGEVADLCWEMEDRVTGGFEGEGGSLGWRRMGSVGWGCMDVGEVRSM